MGIFDFLSSGNEKRAMRQQQAGLQAGRTAAYGELDKGQTAYDTRADQAYGEFDPYARRAEMGANAYANALGLGGDAGALDARNNFERSLGYDFVRDEALQGVERSASAGGYLGSGNLMTALQDRAGGIASQESNGWLDRLMGLNNQGVDIAGQRSGIRTGQGTAAYGTGANRAQIGWNTEAGIGQAGAEYEKSKDQTGINLTNAVMGLLKIGQGY